MGRGLGAQRTGRLRSALGHGCMSPFSNASRFAGEPPKGRPLAKGLLHVSRALLSSVIRVPLKLIDP